MHIYTYTGKWRRKWKLRIDSHGTFLLHNRLQSLGAWSGTCSDKVAMLLLQIVITSAMGLVAAQHPSTLGMLQPRASTVWRSVLLGAVVHLAHFCLKAAHGALKLAGTLGCKHVLHQFQAATRVEPGDAAADQRESSKVRRLSDVGGKDFRAHKVPRVPASPSYICNKKAFGNPNPQNKDPITSYDSHRVLILQLLLIWSPDGHYYLNTFWRHPNEL